MTHLPLVTPATAPVQQLLAEVHRRLGTTPTMTRAMANSPALLQGYLDLSRAHSSASTGGHGTSCRLATSQDKRPRPSRTACPSSAISSPARPPHLPHRC